MGKRGSSYLRRVPWQSWEQWKWVAAELFAQNSPERVSAALDRIAAWESRGNVPIAVETSAALISIHERDPVINPKLPRESALPADLLRMMYAMAIQRLVNGVVDRSQKSTCSSVADRAQAAGLPRLLVDIRHEAAHTELPGLSLLQIASKQALEWLKLRYWEQQKEVLTCAREELKSKLLEHFRVAVDILSPLAPVASLEQPEEREESEGGDPERVIAMAHRESLRARRRQRSQLFDELLEVALPATTDLISILVNDRLLERDDVLGGPSAQTQTQTRNPVEECSSPGDHSNLRSVRDVAWKFTLRELSSRVPRLPGMLLLAIVNHINCCSSPSPWSSSRALEPIQGGGSGGRERMAAWCKWLLGGDSSRDQGRGDESTGRKSARLLKLSSAISVRADLGREFLAELLRLSFRGPAPMVELVSAIAARAGTARFQHRAAALARLGGGYRPPAPEVGTGTVVTPPDGDGAADTVGPSTESALEVAKSRTRAVTAGLSAELRRVTEGDGDGGLRPGRGRDSDGSLAVDTPSDDRKRRWSVVTDWRPCAVGMIVSPLHPAGVVPSLDLPKPCERTEVSAEDGAPEPEPEPLGQQAAARDADVGGKRRNGGELAGDRQKKVVRFAEGDPRRRSSMASAAEEAEHRGGAYMLRGCLLQNGAYMPVSETQLERLRSAVRVL